MYSTLTARMENDLWKATCKTELEQKRRKWTQALTRITKFRECWPFSAESLNDNRIRTVARLARDAERCAKQLTKMWNILGYSDF